MWHEALGGLPGSSENAVHLEVGHRDAANNRPALFDDDKAMLLEYRTSRDAGVGLDDGGAPRTSDGEDLTDESRPDSATAGARVDVEHVEEVSLNKIAEGDDLVVFDGNDGVGCGSGGRPCGGRGQIAINRRPRRHLLSGVVAGCREMNGSLENSSRRGCIIVAVGAESHGRHVRGPRELSKPAAPSSPEGRPAADCRSHWTTRRSRLERCC